MTDLDRDREAVLAANAAFYAAFEMLDYDAMKRAWATSPQVTCIHPGATPIAGRDAVLSSWREIFASTTSIHFTLADVRAYVAGDVAWVVLVEQIEARHDEAVVRASTRATNVFVREAGEYRLVHHHAEPASARRMPARATALN
jgi:ketosteroid isomerase-like protein